MDTLRCGWLGFLYKFLKDALDCLSLRACRLRTIAGGLLLLLVLRIADISLAVFTSLLDTDMYLL